MENLRITATDESGNESTFTLRAEDYIVLNDKKPADVNIYSMEEALAELDAGTYKITAQVYYSRQLDNGQWIAAYSNSVLISEGYTVSGDQLEVPQFTYKNGFVYMENPQENVAYYEVKVYYTDDFDIAGFNDISDNADVNKVYIGDALTWRGYMESGYWISVEAHSDDLTIAKSSAASDVVKIQPTFKEVATSLRGYMGGDFDETMPVI